MTKDKQKKIGAEELKRLVDNGWVIDVNTISKGETYLAGEDSYGHDDIVKLLLDNGAEDDVKDVTPPTKLLEEKTEKKQ